MYVVLTSLNQFLRLGNIAEWGKVCASPLLSNQMNQFSREVVDLLRTFPGCRMPFSKFIPSYHHHFGRQCRVADYGYTKLMELFEALPHIVQVCPIFQFKASVNNNTITNHCILQILGCGSRRYVTLSHRSQIKRFTADLLRVLKSQISKQIVVEDFSVVYRKLTYSSYSTATFTICVRASVHAHTYTYKMMAVHMSNWNCSENVFLASTCTCTCTRTHVLSSYSSHRKGGWSRV